MTRLVPGISRQMAASPRLGSPRIDPQLFNRKLIAMCSQRHTEKDHLKTEKDHLQTYGHSSGPIAK